MVWWGWLVLGGLLFFAELLAIDAQFFLVFMGLSAAIVGLLGLFNVTMPEWGQWIVFATLSLVSMFTFRRALYDKIRGGAAGFRPTLEGEIIDIGEPIGPGDEARAQCRGTVWTVKNVGMVGIEADSRARVVKVDGLKLHVEAQQE